MKNIFKKDYNIKSGAYSIAGALMMALGIVGMGSCKPVVEDDHLPPINNTNTNTGGNQHTVGEDTVVTDPNLTTIRFSAEELEHLPRDSVVMDCPTCWTFDGSGASFLIDSAQNPNVGSIIVKFQDPKVFSQFDNGTMSLIADAHEGFKNRPDAHGKISFGETGDTLYITEGMCPPSTIQRWDELWDGVLLTDTVVPFVMPVGRTR